MAGKVPSPRTFNNHRVADASLVATKRIDPPKRDHKLATSVRALSRCVNDRFTFEDSLPLPDPYRYAPLNDDLNEIRLLTLHEGNFMRTYASLFTQSP